MPDLWPPHSEDVCKRGFTVIIDMRGSKWDLIKPLLKTLQEAFPAEIHVALIIKPDNFWQKQKTNFGSSKFIFEVSQTSLLEPPFPSATHAFLSCASPSTLPYVCLWLVFQDSLATVALPVGVWERMKGSKDCPDCSVSRQFCVLLVNV